MKKLILLAIIAFFVTGCSTHGPSMQEVRSLCRTSEVSDQCMAQDSICESYSAVLIKTYASAKECRMACEAVDRQYSGNINAQGCEQLFDSVSGLCTEYCNGNYK